jgi:DNA repair protein RadC
MGINDWPEQQRPRERLIAEGARALSDPELLAVFLRVGVKGKNAVELGRDLLEHFGSINAMFKASVAEFSTLHGLGPAKFAQLQAVMELAQRAIGEQLQTGQPLGSPDAVKLYLRMTLSQRAHESFVVLFLDVKNRLIASEEMFRGTLTQISALHLRNNFTII